MNFTVEEISPRRLDVYLNEKFSEWSRSHIQKLIADGLITVDGARVKASFKITGGEEIFIREVDAAEVDYAPENLPLDILYEDAEIIVVNKARGMTVHPADTVRGLTASSVLELFTASIKILRALWSSPKLTPRI